MLTKSSASTGQTQPRHSVKLLLALPFLLLVGLLYAAGQGQIDNPPNEAKIQNVEVRQIQLQNSYQSLLQNVGALEAAQRADVGFELAGTLAEVLVDQGDAFTQGQVLAKLDTARLEAQRQEVQAALNRAKADARLAELTQQRVAKVVQQKLESDQRLDEVTEANAVARARVEEIEASLARITVELQKSVIRAPFAGSVLVRYRDLGSVVAAGQNVLGIQNSGGLQAIIALGRDQAGQLQPGQQVRLQHASGALSAHVSAINQARQLGTRTLDVRFDLLQQDGRLLAGDLVSLALPQTHAELGAWVPRAALSTGLRGLWHLYVLAPDTQQAKVQVRAVEVVYSEAERVFVKGAIREGEQLIISGTQRLVPGQLVQVQTKRGLTAGLLGVNP